MKPKPIFWKIFTPFFAITLTAMAILTWYADQAIWNFYLLETNLHLEQSARIVSDRMGPLLGVEAEAERLNILCRDAAAQLDARITVVLPSGKVAEDTEENPARMYNHLDRPEIKQALNGETGVIVRFSDTLKEKMAYVAIPLRRDGQMVGVVRIARSLQRLRHGVYNICMRIFLISLGAAALAAAFSWLVSRRISRPIQDIQQGADLYAKGRFEHHLPLPDTLELAALAETLNLMAAQMDERICTIESQRQERDAVFSAMREGVVALDKDRRVLFLNQAAASLMRATGENAFGKSLMDVTRNADILNLADCVLLDGTEKEEDVVLHEDEERWLQARGTPLRNPSGQTVGAVLVLNDVTRLRRLETVRSDFVANVSHELKTPITTIKGYVETLLDGAMNNEEDLHKFLGIVAKHAGRLNAIIEDLMLLSRLEQRAGQAVIERSENRILETLNGALEMCILFLRNKDIQVEILCSDDLKGLYNAPLMEQAVCNLLSNAIRHSQPGGRVWLEGRAAPEGQIEIHVRDEGCGIPREHLPRLFERFYRVDRARSREQGGTGLGLAIVNHIVQLHGGRVTVESEVGCGSDFAICFASALTNP
ncbi:MAG: ATP-binding protein [Candidatus Sumerlaeota bacterium]|nr:ATP-binding protein [Candidatus Sumerlaeota bacterium]